MLFIIANHRSSEGVFTDGELSIGRDGMIIESPHSHPFPQNNVNNNKETFVFGQEMIMMMSHFDNNNDNNNDNNDIDNEKRQEKCDGSFGVRIMKQNTKNYNVSDTNNTNNNNNDNLFQQLEASDTNKNSDRSDNGIGNTATTTANNNEIRIIRTRTSSFDMNSGAVCLS